MDIDSFINGKVVNDVPFKGYLSIKYFSESLGIDADSLCIMILEKIILYKDVKSINSVIISSVEENKVKEVRVISNINSKKGFPINRKYFIQISESFIKGEIRDMKLIKLGI